MVTFIVTLGFVCTLGLGGWQVVWFMCTGIRPLDDVMAVAPSESETEFHGNKLASALLAGA